jgi:hypothetical protein
LNTVCIHDMSSLRNRNNRCQVLKFTHIGFARRFPPICVLIGAMAAVFYGLIRAAYHSGESILRGYLFPV